MKEQGLKWILGLEVSANHPITCLNPAKTFLIHEAKIENNRLYVRGEETMWFHGDMITFIKN